VNPHLSRADQDRYYAESTKACAYYGTNSVPNSVAEVDRYIEEMRPNLLPHEILEEFLGLASNVPIVSVSALPAQRLLVQAAIDLLPSWMRKLLRLEKGQRLRIAMRPFTRAAVALVGHTIRNGAPQRACLRMGLSASRLSSPQ